MNNNLQTHNTELTPQIKHYCTCTPQVLTSLSSLFLPWTFFQGFYFDPFKIIRFVQNVELVLVVIITVSSTFSFISALSRERNQDYTNRFLECAARTKLACLERSRIVNLVYSRGFVKRCAKDDTPHIYVQFCKSKQ